MNGIKRLILLGLMVAGFSVIAVVSMPRLASAAAGDGGGGGSSGCSEFTHSTCYGAVWRYFKTTSNSFAIKNIGPGYTYATGCGSSGGLFAYVLVNKYYPHAYTDVSKVRSWQIGPVDGVSGNRSIFFGGWTNYRVFSSPSDPMPTSLSAGDYSWYAVEKAFALTKSLGQNSGYSWNGSSSLGWFCYEGLNYNLTPTITGSPSVSEGGSDVSLTPAVSNGGETQSSNVRWEINRFIVDPGDTAPNGATNSSTPASHFGHDAALISGGSGTRQFARGVTTLTVSPQAIGDHEVGTKICYALSVKPVSSTNSNWRHSNPFCVIIAKKPKVNVVGGDLIVGNNTIPVASNIATSTSTKRVGSQNRTFGSWAEYAIFASGQVTGMSSGSGYSEGTTNSNFCDLSLLTFANASNDNCGVSIPKGNYKIDKGLPDIGSRFYGARNLSSASVDISSTSSGVYTRTGIISVRASSDVSSGKWVVINAPNATVNITGDIKYTSNLLDSISDIPQVVIIANRINIQGHVNQVDAWLVARGSSGVLNTCSDVSDTAALTAGICDEQLTINGPVVAQKLLLRRTAGSGSGQDSGVPAETFNLRPDSYLWAVNLSTEAGRVQTVYSKELPPRF